MAPGGCRAGTASRSNKSPTPNASNASSQGVHRSIYVVEAQRNAQARVMDTHVSAANMSANKCFSWEADVYFAYVDNDNEVFLGTCSDISFKVALAQYSA